MQAKHVISEIMNIYMEVSRAAMSNPNGLLSQKLYHCLNQGCTLNDIFVRAAYWMAYFDLSKLNLA